MKVPIGAPRGHHGLHHGPATGRAARVEEHLAPLRVHAHHCTRRRLLLLLLLLLRPPLGRLPVRRRQRLDTRGDVGGERGAARALSVEEQARVAVGQESVLLGDRMPVPAILGRWC